ncbi:MAG: tetratricopeptide repeat protein [Deltaproteobacteria bacterium]
MVHRKNRAAILGCICAVLVTTPAWASSRDAAWTRSMAAGQLAYEAGRYNDAERLLKVALSNARHFGPGDMRLASTLNRLAQVYHDQGQYTKAEPLYKRSLALAEKNLGPAHPDVAANLNDLATLYRDQGEYSQAETLYRRSLAIVRKGGAAESPDVAITLNNLAELYSDQGKFTEAEHLYQQSLDLCEKTQGPKDMSVAISLNNLGTLYDNEKKYDEAENAYQRALNIKEINLGGSDPSIALTLSNLGRVYIAAGKYDQAQPALYRALTILHWPVEANSNPVAGRALNHLATYYRETGNYDLSDYYYKKSLDVTRKSQGPRSSNLAKTMKDYALLLRRTHRPAEAARMEAGAKAIQASLRGGHAPARRASTPPAHRSRPRRRH